jgi:metal-responsive CopG/Arc/MetJ family transcriptional regulator
MATQQVLVRLPEELARRFRRCVSDRRRSEFIQRLLEQALPPTDGSESDPLYQAALAVEKDARLAAEMTEWSVLSKDDGEPAAAWRVARS